MVCHNEALGLWLGSPYTIWLAEWREDVGLIRANTMKDTMGAKHGQKNERTGTKANISFPFRKTLDQSNADATFLIDRTLNATTRSEEHTIADILRMSDKPRLTTSF